MGKIIGVVSGLTLSGCLVCAAAQEASGGYQPKALHFVDLAEGTKISAKPIQARTPVYQKSERGSDAVVVNLQAVIHPNLSGIGGAFNEQGADAFMSLPEAKRKELAEALFNPESGSGLAFCRTAIGSSDFGLSAYSYNETPGDYAMKHFSIARDETAIIPFIHAAQAENADLRLFASPWSPPGWMKLSGEMTGGKDRPELNKLKAEPAIYKAYALYFVKYVQAYAAHQIEIERLVIQNETDMNPIYPGCDMLPDQMADLTFNYIRPAVRDAGLKTELWAGTFRYHRKDAETFMRIQGAETIDGLGLQYCNEKTLATLQSDYPKLKLMHTEGDCFGGKNTMAQARSRFNEIAMWLNGGCENFCYWNMVLNETSKSAWGWRQNSLVRVDRKSGEVTYNPDYASIALFSRFIRPGSQSLKVTTPKGTEAVAVRHKNAVVVFLRNDASTVASRQVGIGDQNYQIELPKQSISAVVFEP